MCSAGVTSFQSGTIVASSNKNYHGMYSFNESTKQQLAYSIDARFLCIPAKGPKTDLMHAMDRCYAYHVTIPRVTP